MPVPCGCPILTNFISEREGKKLNFDLWQLHVRYFSRYCKHPGNWRGKKKASESHKHCLLSPLQSDAAAYPCRTISQTRGTSACRAPPSQSTCPVVMAEESRDSSCSWCVSKSQKTDTESSYTNVVRKRVTLFPMVIELHTGIPIRKGLPLNVLWWWGEGLAGSWVNL